LNHLKIIIPFRNCEKYISDCVKSLLTQTHNNWSAYFCDDASTDNTLSHIPSDPRFIVKSNTKRMTALPNIHFGIIDAKPNDQDIICILDGDDFLIRPDALDIIDNLYNDNTLLTYGQYIWPNGQVGHCRSYSKEEFDVIRKGSYWASHMRTFKYKLYKELMSQDPNLNCYKRSNGEFYTVTYDVAIMTPLMEIAGFENTKFNPVPIYLYRIHEQNDHFVNAQEQKIFEKEIFEKKPFTRKF
jgi:glycosyltransferase involved in cell wall biosynthesis